MGCVEIRLSYKSTTPFSRSKCAEVAKSLGFSIEEKTNRSGCSLGANVTYKEQEVMTGLLPGKSSPNGRLMYYDYTIYVWNDKVIYSSYIREDTTKVSDDWGSHNEIGDEFYCAGTLVDGHFVEAKPHSLVKSETGPPGSSC